MDYSYNDLIEGINSHKISEVHFKVKNYSHYKNCKIIVCKDLLLSKKFIYLINVVLTEDKTEEASFLEAFEEDYKLFRMGQKGTFTLKQLWNEIEILSVSMAN